jgi:hypothetical protein
MAGEERRLPFEGKKIPAHMTRANMYACKQILESVDENVYKKSKDAQYTT